MIRIALILSLLLSFSPWSSAQEAQEEESPGAEAFLGQQRPISLRAAEVLALENNLEIEIARTGPLIAEEGIAAARGAFDPELGASYRFNHNEDPIFSSLQGSGQTTVQEDEWNYSGGFQGLLPFGATYTSRLSQRRLESDSRIVSLDTEWRGVWRNELRVPLLKNLIHNEANVRVKRSRVARDVSYEEFRRELSALIERIHQAYWELSAARAEERVAQKSLQLAKDLLEQTRVQYDVGVVSKVSVTQAEAGVAEREVDAIVAKNRAAAAQDALLNLVLAPDSRGYAETELIPSAPAYIDYQADLDAALAQALENRPELAAARKQVEDAEIQLSFAQNQRLPALDLTGSFQVQGLSGDAKAPEDLLFAPTTTPRDLGSSSDVFDDFFTQDGAQSWHVGANVSIPLGNTTARAVEAERRIELRRARATLKRVEQTVMLEVRGAIRGLRSAREALEAAERRRIAQEETLRAEQEKLRLADSTPFDVLDIEEDLAEAERQEILALQSYRNAITALERGQATLLTSRGISVVRELTR